MEPITGICKRLVLGADRGRGRRHGNPRAQQTDAPPVLKYCFFLQWLSLVAQLVAPKREREQHEGRGTSAPPAAGVGSQISPRKYRLLVAWRTVWTS